MPTNIAILGLSCEFPGASTPDGLWETALMRRRWFRDIPSTRLGHAYIDAFGQTADTTRLRRAAVLEGYAFPQQRFALGTNDLLAADFTHWLALDCADRALFDSGLGDALPRDSTRVIVGNSLTGESSRADLLRLRWPYVRKTLEESGCTGSETDWERREQFFKARFTPIDGRTLAGSLSNVIAGRIANHLNLRGGAYCVDAACASSLVAITQACSQLAAREIDCCIVGGVDVSLDPLELVGFSVAGALANGEMTVFDRNRSGFLPGEGCGFAVLMRADHPVVARCHVRALIRGWSVASDGRHDLTAPSPDGQRLALERTYLMAGYGIETVALFEAHGTGTIIGDQVEINALDSSIVRSSSRQAIPAVISSIKANIGHTKAAAGMAGFIKAVMALETRVLPPVTGCNEPMPEFTSGGCHLRLLPQPEAWPDEVPRRAGVSGFGFGGVNAHIAIEAPDFQASRSRPVPAQWHVPEQDAEIFVFDGLDVSDLRRRIEKLKSFALRLADAELAPAAAATANTLKGRPWRAAVVASNPGELDQHLTDLLQCLADLSPEQFTNPRIFIGRADTPPQIGFLFPGQGGREKAQHGRIWLRFKKLFNRSSPVPSTDSQAENSAAVQSAIIACSTAATKLLSEFGIAPAACLGHSLGEISALYASGVLSETDAIAIARDRGRLMDEQPSARGRMEILFTDRSNASQIVNGHSVSLAAFNSAAQTVIAGSPEEVEAVVQQAAIAKVDTRPLPVHFAFHSPLMQPVAEPFAQRLREMDFARPCKDIYSTVTGERLLVDTDFPKHLVAQLTNPVRFHQAFDAARSNADLWIEVGAGRVLCGLVSTAQAVSIESESSSIAPFLRALAQCFIRGTDVRFDLLHADRRIPHFDLDWIPHFFTNPCERPLPPPSASPSTKYPDSRAAAPLDLVRMILAERKGQGISLESIRLDQTLGPDLGVDSLGLTELTIAAEKALGRRASFHAQKKMTVAEFAALFDAPPETGETDTTLSDLLMPWVRSFEVIWDQSPLLSNATEPMVATDSGWTIITSSGSPPPDFAARLPAKPGSLLIHCEAEADESFVSAMLTALRQCPPDALVVILDSTGQFPGLAKSLALESPDQRILFVHYTEDAIPDASAIVAELCDAFSFREVRYDEAGQRFLPRCSVARNDEPAPDFPISFEDVVLVTGGARGITAECMLALAGKSGASIAIVGRSTADDPAVLATRRKLAEMGVAHEYWSADVSEPATVAALVPSITGRFGPITSIIHGAGTHEPCPIRELIASNIREHCRAKVEGLRNLLSCIDPSTLRLLISFGSVIARSGYEHSGAYAFANDCLARLVSKYQSGHSSIRCLTIDWSAWRDIGMGVSLQAIASLKAAGVDPIRTGDGIAAFLDSLYRMSLGARPILAGRLPAFPTVSFRAAPPVIDLPAVRVVSHTPGVEIVVDTTVSLETHPFLAGHSLDEKVILPGILAIDFMVKVASFFGIATTRTHIRNVILSHPITVPATVVLRIQAVRHADASVHCRLAPSNQRLADDPAVSAEFAVFDGESHISSPDLSFSPLDPSEGTAVARDLYQHLLFHTDAFRIVERYSTAMAKTAVFHLRPLPRITDPVEAETLIRDAFIHGIQICVPGELLLPSQIASIARSASAETARTVIAREISSRDGEFVYDLAALDADGNMVEAWEGLLLRRYRSISTSALHPILRSIDQERTNTSVSPGSAMASRTKRHFEYRHIVGFKETNLVGNVYFTNHLEWQGRCREMFLSEHAADVLREIESGRLVLATVSCSCEYEEELHAFDKLSIRMTLTELGEERAGMRFEYWAERASGLVRVAIGHQTIASRARLTTGFAPIPLPASLISALEPFA